MPNAKVLTRQSFKPLTKEKKLEVWNKVKARIATGEYCNFTAKEVASIKKANMYRRFIRLVNKRRIFISYSSSMYHEKFKL